MLTMNHSNIIEVFKAKFSLYVPSPHCSRVATINSLITTLLGILGFTHTHIHKQKQDHIIYSILQFAFIHWTWLKNFYTTTYKSASFILMSS